MSSSDEMHAAHQTPRRGVFYGVGVGPGDPELLTMKAFRLIKQASVISYLTSGKNGSQAKTIARLALAERAALTDAQEISINMPMSKDRTLANKAYDLGAEQIRTALNAGQDVLFLCEGDPLFFGSFAYLLERLEGDFCCEVVPGISSVNAAACALLTPLTMLKESFAVVSGRHTDAQIEAALRGHDSVVIMKAGQARQRLLDLLKRTGRFGDAAYLEYIGRDNQKVIKALDRLPDEPGPYFSLFVVLPTGARSE